MYRRVFAQIYEGRDMTRSLETTFNTVEPCFGLYWLVQDVSKGCVFGLQMERYGNIIENTPVCRQFRIIF